MLGRSSQGRGKTGDPLSPTPPPERGKKKKDRKGSRDLAPLPTIAEKRERGEEKTECSLRFEEEEG